MDSVCHLNWLQNPKNFLLPQHINVNLICAVFPTLLKLLKSWGGWWWWLLLNETALFTEMQKGCDKIHFLPFDHWQSVWCNNGIWFFRERDDILLYILKSHFNWNMQKIDISIILISHLKKIKEWRLITDKNENNMQLWNWYMTAHDSIFHPFNILFTCNHIQWILD